MDKCARVVVFHRNRLFGECLASALTSCGRFHARFLDHHADFLGDSLDIAVIDVSPQEAASDLAGRLRRQSSNVKVLLLAPAAHYEAVAPAIAAGAQGCILEEASLGELEGAIERLFAGEYFCSPRLVEAMFNQVSNLRQPEPQWRSRVASADLTRREFEILCLVAEGLGNKQIARRLCLSLYTVKNHVHNILQKLQVADRFEAVAHVREQGWLAKAAV